MYSFASGTIVSGALALHPYQGRNLFLRTSQWLLLEEPDTLLVLPSWSDTEAVKLKWPYSRWPSPNPSRFTRMVCPYVPCCNRKRKICVEQGWFFHSPRGISKSD